MRVSNFDKVVAFIIPTGIGAKIGGFAGDASYWANEFSKHFPLIVNPNVVNAAVFSSINEKMLYTSGFVLNELFSGNLHLIPSKNNKIGIIFDRGMEEKIFNIHINTINAMKCVYGFNIVDYVVTEKKVGVEFFITNSKVSSGNIKNPETLINAGITLLEKGVEVIGIVCDFPQTQEEDDDYIEGIGVDIVGGIEAIISDYVSMNLKVITAHAPSFNDFEIETKIVNQKVAAEYITPTFLPSILFGLNNAPKIDYTCNLGVGLKNIKALILPYGCLGSSIVFDSIKNNIPVITVLENKTVLNINEEKLNISNKIIKVNTYNDALSTLLEL